MFDIVAGESTHGDELAVGWAPDHVRLVAAGQVDTERFAEPELTDAELLGLAAEEALEAQAAGEFAGPALDEVALRRAYRRAARADVASALRITGGAVA